MRSSLKQLIAATIMALAITTHVLAPVEAANQEARAMVAEMAAQRGALLTKHPDLSLIDAKVRKDCSARETEEAMGEYCNCASAVTFSLWMSGMDPKMIDRLNEYLEEPNEKKATEFVKYQGPEMYGPLCKEAL